MNDTPAKPVDPVRMMLMHSGAQLTIAMTRKGLTPEDVVAAGNNFVPLDKLLRIMAGSESGVSLAEMSFLCTQLDARFMFGVTPGFPPPTPPDPQQPVPVNANTVAENPTA